MKIFAIALFEKAFYTLLNTKAGGDAMTGEESGKPPDGQKCRHYWVIQPANGPVSQGLCQICGETREFKNYVGPDGLSWNDQPAERDLALAY